MRALDLALIAERTRVLEAHLGRLQQALPPDQGLFRRGTDQADVVSLHLLFGIQVVLDVSVFACIHFGLQAPASYDDSIARLAYAGRIDETLADRLEKAALLRDGLVHAFDDVDAASIYRAARVLPEDLRAFLVELGQSL